MTSVSTDRRLGVNGGMAIKVPCRVATTANITLSGAQTIDGVAVVTDDRVLVKNQTDTTENGIYVADSGSWSRAPDCDGANDLVFGSLVKVNLGTVGQGFYYVSTTGDIVVGTDAVAFTLASSVLAVISAYAQTLLDDVSASAARSTLGFAAIAAKGDLIAGTAANTLTTKTVGTNGMALVADSSQTDGLLWAALAMQPGGRLSLTTAVPVTTSDVTGATTVYYTPHKHNGIMLYDGAGWIPKTFTELSQLTTDATKSPAAVANSSNYDVFVWDNGGTLRATRGPAWTSDTARGAGAGTTELEQFEGRYVNKNAITNGPAARRGVYVGTVRSDASAQINDSVAKRHVWNNYNRIVRPMSVVETTDSWNYSTATFRQANGSTANQLDFVQGLAEDAVYATVLGQVTSSGAAVRGTAVGIGLDSTTVNSSQIMGRANVTITESRTTTAFYRGVPGIGRHALVWLEKGGGADTQTWFGDNAASGFEQAGIIGTLEG